ncbi:hypothetical protein KFZ76_08015 [Methylovulum psychrotolerans]|uniref:hypothetical protein n=1 Tax=Methylovulum psychrotolerans TaxID=1704499 RepID=UPI001BFFBE09|nr:hypothetical protein [Methylovulum psychrotolerans]MBT9097651.1 hypothetical protein [Methylovulum psychrotolerans]
MNNNLAVEIDGITGEVETLPPQKGQRYRCKLDSLGDVKREMAKVYREARSGLVDVQEATKLTWCLQAVGKVIEGSDLEKRIEALEAKNGH